MNLCPAGEAMRGKRCFAFPYYCRGSPENCSPPGAAGRMALPSFFLWGAWAVRVPYSGARSRDSRTVAGEKVLCIPALLPRVARELLPARGGGPDGFAVFFYAGLGLCGHLTTGTEMRRGENLLPVPHSYQGSPENCLHRRWRQRVASTAGGFIDKILGWVYNNAVCCRGFPALDSKQRSVTP